MGAQSKNSVFKQIHNLSGKEVLDTLKKKHGVNEVKTHNDYVKLDNLEKKLHVKKTDVWC